MHNVKKQLGFLFFCIMASHLVLAQGTGINLNTPEATNGYLLFETSFNTHLVDNCGEIVHSWPDVRYTDLHTKLLPNGNLLYIDNDFVYEHDWENNIVNAVTHNDPALRLVYEVILLPNQNYLCLGRRQFSDFEGLGYDIPGTNPDVVDVVVEMDRNSGEVIWEWNISDHVIQERDPSANNYGKLSDHPELLSMDHIATYDWEHYESFMINGMDYNPELDQIALSIRKIGEIAIIDHSTTTAEAAGSTGGNWGKGGDILYRWGNPENYGRGSSSDRILYFQHNPNWIKYGEHKGKIICYNNGLNNPNYDIEDWFSSVPIFDPVTDANGNYVINNGQPFMPLQPEMAYDRINTNTEFYSSYTSAAQVLPSGNIFITEGRDGRCFEVDKNSGVIVWQYDVDEGQGYLFRSEKYTADYPAFDGKDLTPNGTVEDPPNSYNCQLYTSSVSEMPKPEWLFYFDPSQNVIHIDECQHDGVYKVVDAQGMPIQKGRIQSEITLTNCPAGAYFCTFFVKGFKPQTFTFINID